MGNLSPAEKIKRVLHSWDGTTKYLRSLSPDEVLLAIKQEKGRDNGPRLNILFRLAQRHDTITKTIRIQKLLE
jgi:hypothetical protein